MDTSLQKKLRDAGYVGDFDLASLIEACGDEFGTLGAQGGTQWTAFNYAENEQEFGSTPESAVAALWLALNTTT